MTRRIDETDLLGWIEGDLAPDRRALVEQEMRADSALRRRLEAMAADRRALRSLMHAGVAPSGLVSGAIEEAERLALVGGATEPIRIGWHRSRRVLMAAGLLLAVGGVGLIVVVNRGGSSPSPVTLMDRAVEPEERIAMGPPEAPAQAADTRVMVAQAELASNLPQASAKVSLDAFPLGDAVAQMDVAGVAWEHAPNGVLSLPLTSGGRWAQTVGMSGGPRVTSATYTDALRLASVGRLTVRVQGGDAARVEEALRAFGSTGDHGFEALDEDAFGSARYAIEMDRTECEFARLVKVIEEACGPGGQAFFDVALLPAMASRTGAGVELPRQVTGSAPRVNIQVQVEPGAGVKW